MDSTKTEYMTVFEQYNPHTSRFDKLMQQRQQQTQSIVPDLIKSKRKSVVIKSLADLRTQKDCDEIMEDLFSISDSSLSSDEEQDEEEDQPNQQLTTTTTTQAPMPAPAHMLLPHLADYLVKNPDEPPENFLFRHYHRLSLEDLHYPIENIGHIIQSCNSIAEGVYITIDEFEALQGFSRFSTIH
ncbi:hypothetical protein HMPREF1544_04248 [Mucor circinelloides 1006PhL]|uniref:Uncharacterized protein n=1 Tax=Mucor circinelloides f. circinelloides (strain 1006PhL) TaxID=1220926 RepID=S2JKH2_MUCC1|nr:hypothetical protein HMPREF1544_04248 [Mucor circinelloides 1006PhL]